MVERYARTRLIEVNNLQFSESIKKEGFSEVITRMREARF